MLLEVCADATRSRKPHLEQLQASEQKGDVYGSSCWAHNLSVLGGKGDNV